MLIQTKLKPLNVHYSLGQQNVQLKAGSAKGIPCTTVLCVSKPEIYKCYNISKTLANMTTHLILISLLTKELLTY